MLGVIALIIFVFRSIIPLTISIVVLNLAVFYGFTAVLVFFDELHLLTLVFAVTLVGVVIDYCFHAFVYFDHGRAQSNGSKKVRIKFSAIARPLILGFITTALGYIALLSSPLALLSQVAIFMIFGLLGALLFVLMLLPKLKVITRINITPQALKITEILKVILVRLQVKRSLIFMLVSFNLLLSLYFMPLTFNDDVRLLNSSPTWLVKQEGQMARIFNYQNHQRLIIHATSSEALLSKQEKVIAELRKNQPQLVIKSIADLLPSIQKQQQDHQLLKQANDKSVFEQGLNMSGLKDPIENFKPLNYDIFSKSALKSLSSVYIVNYFVIPLAESATAISDKTTAYALWLDISGAQLNLKNNTWINNQATVDIVNKAGDASKALTLYRQGILMLLAVAFVVVGVVLVIRYGLTRGMISSVAVICSALAALICSQWFSVHLNIFNLLAVLLILALAIDYVIFYQEHGIQTPTLLAITLSAISSVLVFGVLMLSTTPAVQSFGLTVMFGIVFIYILAPLSSRTTSQLTASNSLKHDTNMEDSS